MIISNLTIEEIKTKFNFSKEFFDQENYSKAIKYAQEGLKLTQVNGLLNNYITDDFINLIGNSYYQIASTSASPLEVMLHSLEIMRNILPNHPVSMVNIARFMHYIALEYAKPDNLSNDLMIMYITQSLRIMKNNFPDMKHDYFIPMLALVRDICKNLDTNHNIKFLNEGDFQKMYITAKTVYDLSKEFIKSDSEFATYAARLGIVYNKLGMYGDAMQLFHESLEAMQHSDLLNKDDLIGQIQAYLDSSSAEFSKNNQPDAAAVLENAKDAYNLASSYMLREDYQKAIYYAALSSKMLKNNGLDDDQVSSNVKALISNIAAATESEVFKLYQDQRYEEGAKTSIYMYDIMGSMGDNYTKGLFGVFAGEGYYKSGNCEQAMKYLPEGLETLKSSNNSSANIVQGWIDSCAYKNSSKAIVTNKMMLICLEAGYASLDDCLADLAGQSAA